MRAENCCGRGIAVRSVRGGGNCSRRFRLRGVPGCVFASACSIRIRSLCSINDEDRNGSPRRFQLQSELLFQRGEKRGRLGVRRLDGIPFKREIVVASESGLVQYAAIDLTAQNSGELRQ